MFSNFLLTFRIIIFTFLNLSLCILQQQQSIYLVTPVNQLVNKFFLHMTLLNCLKSLFCSSFKAVFSRVWSDQNALMLIVLFSGLVINVKEITKWLQSRLDLNYSSNINRRLIYFFSSFIEFFLYFVFLIFCICIFSLIYICFYVS